MLGSFIATTIALASICYLPFASYATQKIEKRTDREFKKQTSAFQSELKELAARKRLRKQSLAYQRGESYDSQKFFNPAVQKMAKERSRLVGRAYKNYPAKQNLKCDAYLKTMHAMRQMALSQRGKLSSKPFSRSEIDKKLTQKMAKRAERGIADLYDFCLKVWLHRLQKWETKFDREAFCRHCVSLVRSSKTTKKIGMLIRDVREAKNKDRAFKESSRALTRLIAEKKNAIFNLENPWIWVRVWRDIFPHIPSTHLFCKLDQLIDPSVAYLTDT